MRVCLSARAFLLDMVGDRSLGWLIPWAGHFSR
jgi:hypothetical protein